jgi:hypothetical protein
MFKCLQKKRNVFSVTLGLALLLTSGTTFSSPGDISGLRVLRADRESSTGMKVSSGYLKWKYAADDLYKEGHIYKEIDLYATYTESYVVIRSFRGSSSADPKIWYDNNGSMTYLSDDQGGDLNFVGIIHFAPGCYTMLPLYLTHYDPSDLASYDLTFEVYSCIPTGYPGFSCLRVNADNTKTWETLPTP